MDNKKKFISSLIKRARQAQLIGNMAKRREDYNHLDVCRTGRDVYLECARLAKIWL